MASSTPTSISETREDFSSSTSSASSEESHILVTGVTGTGKSTLIDGLTGNRRPKLSEHAGICDVDTTEVTSIKYQYKTIGFTLWDTPGRFKKSALKKLRKCPITRGLVVHCIKSTDTRFAYDNQSCGRAMRKLTTYFGSRYWENAIIALTFANIIDKYRPEWESDKKKDAFQQEIQQWSDCIREYLKGYLSVPEDIVKTIVIIPVGHTKKAELLDGINWIENFHSKCKNQFDGLRDSTSGVKMCRRRRKKCSLV